MKHTADQLIGICRGILADGVVDGVKVEFLLEWMRLNPRSTQNAPGDKLYLELSNLAWKIDSDLKGLRWN